MISTQTYQRICVMSPELKKITIEEMNSRVEAGRELIAKHGEDDLQYKLTEDAYHDAARLFFLYKLAIDESNYEQ